MDRMRPTWVEVDLDRIGHNVQGLKAQAGDAKFMAVVKANGYGHGAAQVATIALAAGAEWLGVAILEEGLELRRAGLTAPILIFGYIPPSQADMVLLYDLRPTVYHVEVARACAQWARALMRKVPVHIKIDTGMGRVGVKPEEAVAFVREVASIPGVEVEGVYTHLAAADEPENEFTGQQAEIFQGVLADLRRANLLPPMRHAANSAGLMLHPGVRYDMVRAGISLYGLPPAPDIPWPVELQPALSWKTRISYLKTLRADSPVSYGCTYRTRGDETIATIPVGYADGLSRNLSNRGQVLVGGVRCPIVGRVCMDQTMVRLPSGLQASVGDEVVLIGQQGEDEIAATEMAQWLGTINYEVVCAISPRVPRLYRENGVLLENRPGR